jgi:hypothetical protein
MAPTEDISPRATLPGTIFKKNGHWWWKVRLPGQDRVRSRSLRPEGSRVGTRSRTQAGQIALRLWEEALTAQAKKDRRKEIGRGKQNRPRIHTGKQELPSDLDPRTPASDICGQNKKPTRLEPIISQAHCTLEPTTPEPPSSHLDWLDSLIGMEDHALCECCGQQDFFEEYLHQIDSGQRLCPRCYGEFKKKAQIPAAERLLCL